jgi:hypothetical protein
LRVPAEDRNRRAAATPDYSVSANVRTAICAPCRSTALALRLGAFETSRIQEACGVGRCGSGDTPILSVSRSPTRMRGSPGACLPATAEQERRRRHDMPIQPARVSVDDTASRAHRAAGVAESLLAIAIGLRAPVRSRDRRHERVHASRGGSRATFPIIRPSRRSVVAARQERRAALSLFETVVARCMARDLRAAKLSRSTRALSSPAPSAAGAWPRSATGFDVRPGLAQGDAKYTDLENRLG